jgi:hypothetical protein
VRRTAEQQPRDLGVRRRLLQLHCFILFNGDYFYPSLEGVFSSLIVCLENTLTMDVSKAKSLGVQETWFLQASDVMSCDIQGSRPYRVASLEDVHREPCFPCGAVQLPLRGWNYLTFLEFAKFHIFQPSHFLLSSS